MGNVYREVAIESDENSILRDGDTENTLIVDTTQSLVARQVNVMSALAQCGTDGIGNVLVEPYGRHN